MAEKKANTPPAPEAPTRTPDAWALDKHGDGAAKLQGVPLLLLAGCKFHHHWVDGDLVTEDAFDKGWAAYATLPTGR